MIRAIRDNIIFQFIDDVNARGEFVEQQSMGGIAILGDYDKSAKQPRWAKIISLGPKCSDVLRQSNIEILIDALRWTESAKVENQRFWKTDETQLLGYRIL